MILSLLLGLAAPCDGAGSALAERNCYGQLAQDTDREMAAQWKTTLAEMRRRNAENRREKLNLPDMVQSLLDSQRAWLRYRDAQCSMVSDQAGGGTGRGDLDNRCRIQLNRQRAMDLRQRASWNLLLRTP
jgi:uncharacterized protein YecT (DUF1311 family)